MREGINESFTIQMVSAFILLFVAFLCLMISYYKCFKTKNEVISIIEKYQGYTDDSVDIIHNYMSRSNYKGRGRCPESVGNPRVSYRGFNIDGSACGANERCNYCISIEDDPDHYLISYNVVMFYSFDIPALGTLASFEVKGKTVDMAENRKRNILLNPLLNPNP